jgi:hypothetical protein
MRIAYITLHLEASILNGGVGKKIQSQISHWKSAGHQVQLFLHSPDKHDFPDSTSYQYTKKISFPLIGFIGKELSRIKALSNLIQAVREYKPDLIYLRYGLFCFPLQKIFTIAPVVVELNTLDQQEYRYRGAIYYWMNRIGRQMILSNAAGFTATSEEIAKHPTNIRFDKSTIVISNGIELSNFDVMTPTHNMVPRLVFIGTPGYPWHGVDKIIEFAILKPDIHIDIIGYSKNDLKMEVIPVNVACHGFLQSNEYKNIFSTCDAAIGTLALHRKEMEEASPLKVREYLIHGLPVIIGYCDTDLSNRQYNFVCQIPNRENNIQEYSEQIYDFAYRMMEKRVDRNLIAPLIDQSLKEKMRLEFFAQIIGKHDQ